MTIPHVDNRARFPHPQKTCYSSLCYWWLVMRNVIFRERSQDEIHRHVIVLRLKSSINCAALRHRNAPSGDTIINIHTKMWTVVAATRLAFATLSHHGSRYSACALKPVTRNQESILIFLPFALNLQDDELIMNSQGHSTDLETS